MINARRHYRVFGPLERNFLEYSFSGNDNFIGTKVLGTIAPEERKFHSSECSLERKFLERSLIRSTEQKFHGSESSFCGLFAPENETAEERKGLHLRRMSVIIKRYPS